MVSLGLLLGGVLVIVLVFLLLSQYDIFAALGVSVGLFMVLCFGVAEEASKEQTKVEVVAPHDVVLDRSSPSKSL